MNKSFFISSSCSEFCGACYNNVLCKISILFILFYAWLIETSCIFLYTALSNFYFLSGYLRVKYSLNLDYLGNADTYLSFFRYNFSSFCYLIGSGIVYYYYSLNYYGFSNYFLVSPTKTCYYYNYYIFNFLSNLFYYISARFYSVFGRWRK